MRIRVTNPCVDVYSGMCLKFPESSDEIGGGEQQTEGDEGDRKDRRDRMA